MAKKKTQKIRKQLWIVGFIVDSEIETPTAIYVMAKDSDEAVEKAVDSLDGLIDMEDVESGEVECICIPSKPSDKSKIIK